MTAAATVGTAATTDVMIDAMTAGIVATTAETTVGIVVTTDGATAAMIAGMTGATIVAETKRLMPQAKDGLPKGSSFFCLVVTSEQILQALASLVLKRVNTLLHIFIHQTL